MKRLVTVAALLAAATPALANVSYLKLAYQQVRTDPAGAFVNVAVQNSGTLMLSQIVVSCDFFAGKKKIGTASTTLFSTFPGMTGQDQVRLLGASAATSATCAITSPQS